jgi:hypothetical protein
MRIIHAIKYRGHLRRRLQETQDAWATAAPLQPQQRSLQWPPRIRERRAAAQREFRRSLRLVPQS